MHSSVMKGLEAGDMVVTYLPDDFTNSSSLMWNTTLPPAPSSSSSEPGWLVTLRIVCGVGLILPISVLGIIGNVLAFIVLCNHKQKLTTTVVLQGLSIVDTLILICSIMMNSLRYIGWADYVSIIRYVYCWVYPMVYFLRLSGTWLTVLLTIDRFIAVCYPLHAQRLCHLRRTYIIMVAVVTVALLFSLVRFFEFELVPTSVHKDGFALTSLIKNRAYTVVYRIIIFFIFMYLIPMTLLIALNTRLLCTLRRASAFRATLTNRKTSSMNNGSLLKSSEPGTGSSTTQSNKATNRSITIIVTTVVLVCISSNMAAMVSHVLWALPECFENMNHLSLSRRVISNISNVLIVINSAINFVIYCLCSKNFRTVFARTFGCDKIHRRLMRGGQSMGGDSKRKSMTVSSYISLRRSSNKHQQNQGVVI